MRLQWQPPAQWEDFEDLCYHLALAKGTLASAQKYGRRGQKQFGIDIVGTTAGSRTEWIGIQCKLKSEHLGSTLTDSELNAEYFKSIECEPKLTHWILATTSPRDTAIQDAANSINQDFRRKHTVELWFWEDLSDLLTQHENVAQRFYPAPRGAAGPVNFSAGLISIHIFPGTEGSKIQLTKFLQHPRFIACTGSLAGPISTLVLEAIDNCFHRDKGAATRISVEFDGVELRLSDNGATFDPLNTDHRLGDEQLGLKAIRAVHDPANNVMVSYQGKDVEEGVNLNCLTVSLGNLNAHAERDSCIQYMDVEALFVRGDAYQAVDQLNIPSHCDPYVLRLVGSGPISVSGTHQLILQLKQRLGSRRLQVVVGPHRRHVFDHLVGFSAFREKFEIIQE